MILLSGQVKFDSGFDVMAVDDTKVDVLSS